MASLLNFEANAKSFTFNYPNDFDDDPKNMQNGLPDSFAIMYDPVLGQQYFRFTDTVYYQGAKII